MNDNFSIFYYEIQRLKNNPLGIVIDEYGIPKQISGLLNKNEIVKRFKQLSEDVLNNPDLEQKEKFVECLCDYLGIKAIPNIVGRLLGVKTLNIEVFSGIISFLAISLEKFSIKFPLLKNHLISNYNSEEDKFNSIIKFLLVLLEQDEAILEKIKGIEESLKGELSLIISEIHHNPQIIGTYEKTKVIFLIKNIATLYGLTPDSFGGEIFKILTNFLEGELLISFKELNNYVGKLGFNLVRNDSIKTTDESKSSLGEVSSIVSNGNFTKNPLIVTFLSYPGGSLQYLVFQEQQIFISEDTDFVKIFNGDKNAFLEELARVSLEYDKNLGLGEIYSRAIFIKKGMDSTPPTNVDFSYLISTNENSLLKDVA